MPKFLIWIDPDTTIRPERFPDKDDIFPEGEP
jgi:hypothetical protein